MAAMRYLVTDVDAAVAFYTTQLGFSLVEQYGPAMAIVEREELELWLAGPAASAARPMPDGRQPAPGGWNRIVLDVTPLGSVVDALRAAGTVFRSDLVKGPGGTQVLIEDPSGNPIELFEARVEGADAGRAAVPLMILVAGPYRSGTGGDPARIAANVDAMTRASLELLRRGHLPVMGEWFALPLIEAAERWGWDGDPDTDLFHPVAEAILARCDACLRIGGASEGADRMVATATALGKHVFTDLEQIP